MLPRPKRQKRPKMGVRVSERIDCPSHLAWLRGNVCCVSDAFCEGRIEAAHVRIGTDGGVGKKPSDCYALPMCSTHHRLQHDQGERTFWGKRNINPIETALSYWEMSPHGRKWRMEHKG